ncbi:MAG: hypothetical protein II287_09390 [Bacteroidaceae bacterium]|nr:hypothetical protein [Bacteroidaceae bacterium]
MLEITISLLSNLHFFLYLSVTVSNERTNDAYPTIRVNHDEDFRIWGVVTYNIKKL